MMNFKIVTLPLKNIADIAAKSTTDLKILQSCSEIGFRYRKWVEDLAAGINTRF